MIFKRKEEEGCKHDFVDISPLVINNLPRMVAVCKKCGVAVHRKIYTTKQLQEENR